MRAAVILVGGLFLSSPAVAGDYGECLSMRTVSGDLISKAKRAEAVAADNACPIENFRTRLNSVSDWAWMTDTRGRQACRDEFRADTPAIYVDKFGNDYRSELGKQTAQDMELLAMEMQSSECPTVDFKWRTKMPEPTVLPWEDSEDETWLEP